jgi:amino acid adenylation domain-containing protein
MRDDLVAIMMADSPALLVGILAVLRSRNGFIPINPHYPLERIHFIIRDCRVKVLLTDRANIAAARQLAAENPVIEHLLCLDTGQPEHIEIKSSSQAAACPLSGEQKSDQTCYVIYTSGSTGRPKGVPITHRNLLPLLTWFQSHFCLGEHTRVLQNLSYSFDFGVFEILTTLVFGGTFYFLERTELPSLVAYVDFVIRHHINTLHTTPTFFNHIVSFNRQLPEVRIVHFGGEELSGKLFRKTARLVPPDCTVYNGYGPTEATINTAIFSLKASDALHLDDSDTVPIGRPSARHRVYIMDRNLQLCPLGVAGELCIAGPGLSAGYLNNPQLTADKFVENSIIPESKRSGAKFYRTGDLCRFRPDGQIEFLGRIDDQVKVRGFRIELGEIESRLLDHDAVEEAVVLPRKEGDRDPYLTAYIVLSGDPAVIPALRQYLSEKLPDYMIPAYFVPMESLPLTPSGKVDRASLPEAKEGAFMRDHHYVAPRDEQERKITAIWQAALGIQQIGIEDDFFELGGDSILANRVIARLREELKADLSLRNFFENPCIRALARAVPRGRQEVVCIPRVSRQGNIPLSFPQERLWFLQQLDQESTAYHVPRSIRIRGKLDVPLLERTFSEIIRRHEILRTVFPLVEERPVQRIQKPFGFHIAVKDWRDLEEEEQKKCIENFVLAEGQRPFDFEEGPLLRASLLKLKEEEHLFVLTEHHLIHDGWTQGVMLKEFMTLFSAFSRGEPSPLPELPIQYADFALWQRDYMQGERLEGHLNYWRQKLADLPPRLELPTDRGRPPVISGRGEVKNQVLTERLSESLKIYSKEKEVTFFMTLLSVFKVLLYRYLYAQITDICVGTGIANRRYRELEGMLGMVINTLPLRTTLSGDSTFSRCLQRVRQTCVEAYEHEETPFEKIVETLRPERSLSYTPIFQVLFSFMDTPSEFLRLPGLELSLEESHNRSSKFDLNIIVIPPLEGERRETHIEWEYNTDLYVEDTIARMQAHYIRLLEAILTGGQEKIEALPLLAEAEARQLLHDWNNTRRDYPEAVPISRLFEEQAAAAPDRLAVVHGYHSLSYGDLNRRATTLSGFLLSRGVQPAEAVAIIADRSLTVVVGILGILKAGAAYLPIAVDFPLKRQKYLLRDGNVRVLLTTFADVDLPVETMVDPIEPGLFTALRQETRSLNGSSLAYIMYTSGSTGTPKGIMVEHHSVVRLVKGAGNANFVDWQEAESILQTGPLEFDASTFEVWGALLNGLRLCLVAREHILAPERLKAAIHQNRITTMWMTVALFNQMADTDIEIFSGLRHLLVGGEALSPPHIHRLRSRFPDLKVFNGYGPTENTTFSTTFLIDRQYRESIPIGRPITNSTAYIVDRCDRLVPVGVSGELLVGGEGVARGYLNNPELTADKFMNLAAKTREDARSTIPKILTPKSYILNPKSQPLYRTGDLARFLPDGNIEFLGRIDTQVKIRGFRIEPGEIESRLLAHPAIREAVVIARADKNNDKAICAYIVPHQTNRTNLLQLRQYLLRTLPDYMIPTYFIPLDHIPVTSSGKVDRRALSELEVKMEEEMYATPASEVEEKLVAIWAEVLSIKTEIISATADFFALGGHSLRAVVLTARIHKELDVRVPLEQVFLTPTIRGLAEYIRGRAAEKFESVKMVEEREYYGLSSAQKRLYIIQQMDLNSTAYNISQVVELDMEIDRQRLEQAFRRLIERHESFRTSFITVDEAPVQRIVKEVDFEIEYDGQAEAFVRPFDLSRPPLLRVGLRHTSASGYGLMVDMHHIIGDGVSMQILARDFWALYKGERLTELKLRCRDYAGWQGSDRVKERIKGQEQYWLEMFAPEVPVLSLPTDYPRPLVQSFDGRRFGFHIGKRETENLNSLASAGGATLYMVLLALLTVLLAKLSGQEDIVVGTPTTGRPQAGLENIVGMFVNTLAMRNCPHADQTFGEFLQHLRYRTLKALENQEYQFEDLVDNVSVDRNTGRNPLFDVMLNVLNQWEYDGEMLKPAKTGEYEHREGTSKFDLYWAVAEGQQELSVYMEYSAQLFKPQTIERFIRYFKQMLTVLDRNPEIRLSDIELITEEERRQILTEFNFPPLDFPLEKTVHRVFVEQAEHTPDHIALIYQGRLLTYRELHRRSNRLAHLLRAKGVFSDVIVGLMVDRSLEMVTGILGILKAGGAYLPIDPAYPEKRKGYMIEGSGLSVLLTGGQKNGRDYQTGDISIIEVTDGRSGIDRNPAYAGRGSDLVYLIYTSGSTGRPKGVMLEHGNVMNLIYYQYRYTNIDFSRVLQFTTIGFDVSFQEIFSTLLCGGALILIPGEMPKNIPELCRLIAVQKIRTLFLPASFLKFVFNEEEYATVFPAGVRHIVTAGEQLIVTEKLSGYLKANRVHLHNHYGPSETHVVTALTMDPEGEIPGLPAIGKPLVNTHIYILDRDFHLQPVGVAGELLIGGIQVGRGYLNRPELTADKFMNLAAKTHEDTRSPIHKILTPKSQPLYRTGDLARFLPDGNIEFLGRIDTQVKIRGFRIELAEIESQLLAIDAIREAVVIVREKKVGEKILVAYVAAHEEIEGTVLKETLSKVLPDYMVPSYFMQLTKIPLTANGKVDRKALPEPEIGVEEDYVGPGNEVERKLAAIWSGVLGIAPESIGINRNFFEIGGHSLKATILAVRIYKELHVKVPLAEIFRSPFIKDLGQFIGGSRRLEYEVIDLSEKREYYPVSSLQERMLILNEVQGIHTAYNLMSVWTVEGKLEDQKLEAALRLLVRRHESLRTSFAIVDGTPIQRVHDRADCAVEFFDWIGREREPEEIIGNFARPFDLSCAPLLRMGSIKLAEERYILMFDVHHIVSDGTSMNILARDLVYLYEGRGRELPPLRVQYKDFARWCRFGQGRRLIGKQEEYWLGCFAGFQPERPMFTDYPRPSVQSFAGERLSFTFDKALTGKIYRLMQETSATLYMVLLAALNILLLQYTDRQDIVVGTPIAGREHDELGNIVGMFVNVLAMRNFPPLDKTFAAFLAEVREHTIRAYENQRYPYGELVEKIFPRKDFSRNPLYDLELVVLNMESMTQEVEALKVMPYPYENKTTQVDISIYVQENGEYGESIDFRLVYCRALYRRQTMERFIGFFKEIVSTAADQPGIKIKDIRLPHQLGRLQTDPYRSAESQFTF